MKKFLLLAACGLAMTVGCQNSGHSDVATTSDTTHTTSATAHTTAASPAAYTMSYQAVRDTEWVAGTEAGAKRGTLRAGDRVMFAKAPNTALAWQQAQLPNNGLQWVRPADFRASDR